MMDNTTWSTVAVNLISAIPPTIAAIAAMIVARKPSPETSEQLVNVTEKVDKIATDVTGVKNAILDHVSDKVVHRSKR